MSLTQKITDGTVRINTSNANGLLDVAPTTTTLATALTDTTGTTVVLASSTGVVSGRVINIGTEHMLVMDDSASPTFIVERGYDGTTAATHLSSATVNVPGQLIYQLLSIADVPNVDLWVAKVSAATPPDINYVSITAHSGEFFPGGGNTYELGDTVNGIIHIKFPAFGTTLLLPPSSGVARVGPTGPPGPSGGGSTPPGVFTIGTVTAEWVVIYA